MHLFDAFALSGATVTHQVAILLVLTKIWEESKQSVNRQLLEVQVIGI